MSALPKVAITGFTGFLGRALSQELSKTYAVHPLHGDVRDPETFADIDHTYRYLFHFGAPSSQVLFKRDPRYCVDVTVNGFLNAAEACRTNGVRLVYPSTGILSSGRFNEYAMCKKLCEDLHAGMGLDAVGLRIFATYGPGEVHKRDYASVPYLFAKDISEGRSPVIFGDGNQVRDFLYISDVVQAVLRIADSYQGRVIDIGSGAAVSFNDLVGSLRASALKETPPVTYVNAPAGYVAETLADTTEMNRFWVPKVDLFEGLQRVVRSINKGATQTK